jgi:hypothetical protein
MNKQLLQLGYKLPSLLFTSAESEYLLNHALLLNDTDIPASSRLL